MVRVCMSWARQAAIEKDMNILDAEALKDGRACHPEWAAGKLNVQRAKTPGNEVRPRNVPYDVRQSGVYGDYKPS